MIQKFLLLCILIFSPATTKKTNTNRIINNIEQSSVMTLSNDVKPKSVIKKSARITDFTTSIKFSGTFDKTLALFNPPASINDIDYIESIKIEYTYCKFKLFKWCMNESKVKEYNLEHTANIKDVETRTPTPSYMPTHISYNMKEMGETKDISREIFYNTRAYSTLQPTPGDNVIGELSLPIKEQNNDIQLLSAQPLAMFDEYIGYYKCYLPSSKVTEAEKYKYYFIMPVRDDQYIKVITINYVSQTGEDVEWDVDTVIKDNYTFEDFMDDVKKVANWVLDNIHIILIVLIILGTAIFLPFVFTLISLVIKLLIGSIKLCIKAVSFIGKSCRKVKERKKRKKEKKEKLEYNY